MSSSLIENPSLHASPAAEFLDDVLKGLSSVPRSIPSKYFYDDIGSTIFDEICELDEYYPTRAESEIMYRYGD